MIKERKPFIEWKFAQKRDEWMRQLSKVPSSDLSSGAKLVAFRISLYMREKQRRAFPSLDALAKACGLSGRIVQDHTKALQQAGWIAVERKRNSGNAYWLEYPFVKDGELINTVDENGEEDSEE